MLILFDENFPFKIAEGLNIIESTNRDTILKCEITHPTFIDKTGTDDDDWIVFAGKNDAIIMTFDKDFKDIKSKGRLYTEHKVGVFFFKFDKKEKMYWQIVRLFVNNFEAMKRIILDIPRPFVYRISSKGNPERYEF
jgi:predicted nuclease of predicted toxin-antitoxin system